MMMKIGRSTAGFTLIELMVTMAIIGILAAVAIPGYIGFQQKARRSVAWTDLQSLRLLEEQFFAENNVYLAGVDTATLTIGLPAFQPDPGSRYVYSVVLNGVTGFTASANSPDDAIIWTIDESNTRNF